MHQKTLTLYLILCCLPLRAFPQVAVPTQLKTASTHSYSVPIFNDPEAFDRMSAAFPIIEQLYFDYADANHFPSISFGIVADGKLMYTSSSGTANLSTGTKAGTKTLYRVASMSKSFTSMAILKLRDEGKLDLTDPVANYIAEMNLAGQLTADAPAITVQHLMTMSAGFPEDNPWGDRQLDATDEELLDILRKGVSFSNVPGVNYEYSNLGYALLGKIIANVSGRPYQQYIKEEILLPLGMESTEWEYSEIPEESLARGYLWQDGEWEDVPYLHDGSYGAMGGLISSIEDFSKYIALHLDAWPPRDDPDTGPVRRSSIREMHQPWRINTLLPEAKTPGGADCPAVVAYGYGVSWQKDCRGIVRIAHSGGLPGFGSEWRIYPDFGVGIVSFSNRTYGAPSSINGIALDTLIAIADLKPRSLPTSKILEQRKSELAEVLTGWEEGKLGIFADNFFLDEPLEQRKTNAKRLFDEAGTIQEISELSPLNQLRGSFLLIGQKNNIRVFFTLNPQKDAFIQQVKLDLVNKP
ncbi:MAG TPA: serine hydrolase domain-containing protein [Lunatimonas sp.]|nr:serine hydrolase domain-containing protein [Lunatimonas sp.]